MSRIFNGTNAYLVATLPSGLRAVAPPLTIVASVSQTPGETEVSHAVNFGTSGTSTNNNYRLQIGHGSVGMNAAVAGMTSSAGTHREAISPVLFEQGVPQILGAVIPSKSETRAFTNGVRTQMTSGSALTFTDASIVRILIGARINLNAATFFNGKIHWIAIYYGTLSDAQMADLAAGAHPAAVAATSLRMLWDWRYNASLTDSVSGVTLSNTNSTFEVEEGGTFDDFDRSEVGSNYNLVIGSLAIVGNRLRGASIGSNTFSVLNSVRTNGRFAFDVPTLTNDAAIVPVWRVQDFDNYYGVFATQSGIEIYKLIDGVPTTLDEALVNVQGSRVRIEFREDDIEVYVDEVLTLSATDSDIAVAGQIAMDIAVSNTAHAEIDNLELIDYDFDSGLPVIEGSLAVSEESDGFASAGSLLTTGSLAVTEEADGFAAVGEVVEPSAGVSVLGTALASFDGSTATPGALALSHDVPANAKIALVFSRWASQGDAAFLTSLSSTIGPATVLGSTAKGANSCAFGYIVVENTGSGHTVTPTLNTITWSANLYALVFLDSVDASSVGNWLRDWGLTWEPNYGLPGEPLQVVVDSEPEDSVFGAMGNWGFDSTLPDGATSLVTQFAASDNRQRVFQMDESGDGSTDVRNPYDPYGTLVVVSIIPAGEPFEGITGDLAVTEEGDSFAAIASNVVSGDLTVSEGSDTLAAVGSLLVGAQLEVTEGADSVAAVGSVVVAGSLSVAEGSDVAAAVARAIRSGSLVVTESQDSFAAYGSLLVQSILYATEAGDTASITGSVLVSGALSVTEQPDTFLASSSRVASVVLATTEQPDTFAGELQVLVTGNLTAQEAVDSISAAVSALISGSLSASESADTFGAVASVVVSGSLNVTEAADTFFANSSSSTIGRIAVTEAADSLAVSGKVFVSGSLDIAEGSDGFAGAASVIVTGNFAVTEAADSFAGAGGNETAARLAVVEPGDTVAVAGRVLVRGSLAVTEGADGFAAGAMLRVTGSLQVTEAADSFLASSLPINFGIVIELTASYGPIRMEASHATVVRANASRRSTIELIASQD